MLTNFALNIIEKTIRNSKMSDGKKRYSIGYINNIRLFLKEVA